VAAVDAATAVPSRVGGWRTRRPGLAQWLEALPFLLPTIIGFFVFIAGPVIAAFILSFTKWDLLTAMPLFWKTLGNTLHYTILYLVPGVTLPLLAAIFMNQKARMISIYRSIFFLPVVTSTVAVALVWAWLYNPEFGLINFFLDKLGVRGPLWLGDPRTAMLSIVIMSVWKSLVGRQARQDRHVSCRHGGWILVNRCRAMGGACREQAVHC